MSTTRPNLDTLSPEEKRALLKQLRAEQARARQSDNMPRRTPAERAAGCVASFGQTQLWLAEQMNPGAYNIAVPLRIRGAIDTAALEHALTATVERHEILRTVFDFSENTLTQRVRPASAFTLDRENQSATLHDAAARATEEAQRPFDLAKDLPFRATLVCLGDKDHLLLLTAHHIAFDGHSVSVLLAELRAAYTGITLQDASLQYGDHAAWERAQEKAGAFTKAREYWRTQLAKAPAPVLPPGDRYAPETREGALVRAHLPKPRAEVLRTVAAEMDTTLFVVLLAAYGALLHRYTGDTDLVVGSPVAQRNHPELETAIGYHVNMLALRLRIAGDDAVEDAIAAIRRTVLDALEHLGLPHACVTDALAPQRNGSHESLFRTTFSLQPRPPDTFPLGGASLTLQPHEVRRVRFDLELHAWEHEGGIEFLFFHARARYSEGFMERFAARYLRFLEAIAENTAQTVHALPLLAPGEFERITRDWNPPAWDYPRDQSIPALFARHAAHHPAAPAIDTGSAIVTYRQLDAMANGLAQRLSEDGLAPEEPVAIVCERGAPFVAAALAVLAAGGAYLPIDPAWPDARMETVLRDAGVRVGLCAGSHTQRLRPWLPRVITLDSLEADDAVPLALTPGGGRLAYIKYTSGSTGSPKGIAVTHRNVARLVCDTNYIEVTPSDAVAFAANTAFDAITFEIWAPLLNGARAVVIDRETLLDPPAFDARLRDAGVTILFLTTAYFNQLARRGFPAFARLRVLLFGGEQADAGAVRHVLETFRPQQLVHVYGPTETTTFATFYDVHEVADDARTVPIGRAIGHSTAYVVDERGRPTPPDVPGEIMLGGDGVARGYLNDPERTAACFVPDPFSAAEDARLYRTGDLARYTPDGDIVFLGRRDRQVKIRGHRIEPAELETQLAHIPGIQAAHVAIHGDTAESHRLIAYVTTETQAKPGLTQASESPSETGLSPFCDTPPQAKPGLTQASESPSETGLSPFCDTSEDQAAIVAEIRQALHKRIPAFLMPDAIVLLESLPLTPNGKVDVSALPPPQAPATSGGAPATPTEHMLAEVWRALLPASTVNRNAHFFEHGGNSLTAVQFLNEVENRAGVHVPPHVWLTAPTIAALATWLDTHGAADAAGAALLDAADPFPTLVPLKPSGTRQPFYFVSPAGGVVFPYFEMVVRLPEDQPVYGLQDPGLHPDRALLPDLASLVDHHIAVLREHQPHGPYYLGGWSFGGLVAYEMAQRLAREGDNVPLLVLWDTHARYDRVPPPRNPLKRLAGAIHEGYVRFGEIPRALPHVIDGLYLRAWYNARQGGGLTALRARAYLLYLRLLRRWSRYAHDLHTDPRVTLHKLPTVPRVLRILQANDLACRAYRPAPYEGAGKVLLFRASKQPHMLQNAPLPCLGWSPYVPPAQFTAHTINGGHMWLFTGPALEEQLPLFTAALDEAQQER